MQFNCYFRSASCTNGLTNRWSGKGSDKTRSRTAIDNFLLAMRMTTMIMLVATLSVSAKGVSQNVTFSGRDVSLEKVFDEVKKQTGLKILYTEDVFTTAKPITVDAVNLPVERFLELALKNQTVKFIVESKTIFISKKEDASPAGHLSTPLISPSFTAPPITGIVRGPDGQPLAGVNIVVKGTKTGTTSNPDGTFAINANKGDVLLISSVGYADKQIVISNSAIGIVSLAISESKLDEVQIIAYGQTSQRLSTGNISSVKAEEIARSPVNNPLLAIQGRIPGVFIETATGIPGAGIKVRIQGQNSMVSGNDPYYVIDGVPYTSQLLPSISGVLGSSGDNNTQGNPLSFINPTDIESIDVLKDADATAIYGSRAANGAILITTKKGKAGKLSVDVNLQKGWGKRSRKIDLLNTEQYLQMRNEAYANDNASLPTILTSTNRDLLTWDKSRYTDWQKELIGGTAQYTNAQISLSGGNATTQFLSGGSYQRETAVTPSDLSDAKIAIHTSIQSKSTDGRFKISISGNYLADNNQLSAGVQSLVNHAFLLPPNAPALTNTDGSLNWEIQDGKSTFNNPLAVLNWTYTNKTNNLVASSNLSYELIPRLRLSSNFGYNKLQSNQIVTVPSTIVAPEGRSTWIPSAEFGYSTISTWIIEPQITYNLEIANGKVDILVGSTIQQEDRDRLKLNASGYASDLNLENIKAAGNVVVDPLDDGTIISQYKYNAIFGRVNYNYRDKYIVSGNVRRDGTSRFGSSNRFNSFYSFAGAWIFSNESFFNNLLEKISFGKIRVSYGTTGNDQIGDYKYLNRYNYTYDGGSPYQGIRGLEPQVGFPNPYLQWESTRKLSATLDLGFIHDRIIISSTFYQNRSSNQLLSILVPTMTGGNEVATNRNATVQNTGVELSINTSNITKKEFSWTSSINLTVPRNKLYSYNEYDKAMYEASGLIGRPLGVIKVYSFAGVNRQTGDYLFNDKDGNIISNPDADLDRTIFINLSPTYYGGFQNTFSYRNISLDLLFQFVNNWAIIIILMEAQIHLGCTETNLRQF